MLKVIFFARLRELLELEFLSVELSGNITMTVETLLSQLREEHNTLDDYLNQGNKLMIAVNQQTADLGNALQPGDEVAFFPPVTGG